MQTSNQSNTDATNNTYSNSFILQQQEELEYIKKNKSYNKQPTLQELKDTLKLIEIDKNHISHSTMRKVTEKLKDITWMDVLQKETAAIPYTMNGNLMCAYISALGIFFVMLALANHNCSLPNHLTETQKENVKVNNQLNEICFKYTKYINVFFSTQKNNHYRF